MSRPAGQATRALPAGRWALARTRRARWAVLVTLASLAPVLAVALATPADAASEKWGKEVARLEERLARKDWKGTLERAVELRQTMVERVDDAAELLKPLAETLMLQALAEANLGRDDDALWHWQAAQSWLSGLDKTDLAAYGRAREVLAPRPLPEAPQAAVPPPPTSRLPAAPTSPGGQRRYQPVRIRQTVRPLFPRSLAASAMQGKVRVRLLIGTDGRPRQPAVLATGIVPSMAFPVLDALRNWLFDPATDGKQPVPVDYQVEIRYP